MVPPTQNTQAQENTVDKEGKGKIYKIKLKKEKINHLYGKDGWRVVQYQHKL